MSFASCNKGTKIAVNKELSSRVKRVVGYHLHDRVDDFVHLIDCLEGVFTGYSFLEFANGKRADIEINGYLPLEIVIPSSSLPDIARFFTTFMDDRLIVSKNNLHVDRLLTAGTVCDAVLEVYHLDVGLSL